MKDPDTNEMPESELVPYWRNRALQAEKRETELMVRHAKLKDTMIQIYNLPVNHLAKNALWHD